MIDIEVLKERLIAASHEVVKQGRFYGYPECCIQAFVESFDKFPNHVTEEQEIASEYKGFIPCIEHAKQILEGKIKLEDDSSYTLVRSDIRMYTIKGFIGVGYRLGKGK